jgi:hypothetical protein
MLNVYYFFSTSHPPYLPTESEMDYARKHCMPAVPDEWDSVQPEVLNNIVKVRQNLQFAYAGLLGSDCGRGRQ